MRTFGVGEGVSNDNGLDSDARGMGGGDAGWSSSKTYRCRFLDNIDFDHDLTCMLITLVIRVIRFNDQCG